MKSKLIKVAMMVVIALTFIVAAPPGLAWADDDKPPPCKPAEHDCRCDPGHNPDCDPPCPYGMQAHKSDDDDDCKNQRIRICFLGDKAKDPPEDLLDRNPWYPKTIKRSDWHKYTDQHAYRIQSDKECPRSKSLIPTAGHESQDMAAKRIGR